MMDAKLPPVGFLGGGKMATALIQGILRARLADAGNIFVGEPLPEARDALARATGVRVISDNAEVVRQAQVVVLAVKPQVMEAVLREIAPLLGLQHLVVSVAAGISLKQIEGLLGSGVRVVRVMPNTPCLVGCGASCYALGNRATAADGQTVKQLLGAVGSVHEVPESLLDAVTGLSGSGPAFVAVVVEALADGGVRVGLPRSLAHSLAVQTVWGTAQLLRQTGQHPAQLKDDVASPGGTTIAGLHALEKAGLRAALIDAVEAATRRAAELGRQ
jgi:pyrroline-5-carboxylate reductase